MVNGGKLRPPWRWLARLVLVTSAALMCSFAPPDKLTNSAGAIATHAGCRIGDGCCDPADCVPVRERPACDCEAAGLTWPQAVLAGLALAVIAFLLGRISANTLPEIHKAIDDAIAERIRQASVHSLATAPPVLIEARDVAKAAVAKAWRGP